MERFTISLDDELARAFDAFIADRGYANRSEAVRDLIRARLEASTTYEADQGHCVASLSYVYDHDSRELAERLAARQHAHHDLTVASMHVHLDHEACLETVVLQGQTRAVRAFASALIAEPGVRHGALNLVGVERGGRHSHGAHSHVHLKPRF
jgi:CopG family transcriptional regulator, nickel-responsive regulator